VGLFSVGTDRLPSVTNRLEAERAELEAVLASGFLGRTNNLVRLLTFVCEKYFEGETDEIKEYSIALQALGRPQNFDPQVDTIVRVTAHTLRKRLEEYYRTEGADHAVQICLPPGRYVPSFVRKGESPQAGNGSHVPAPIAPAVSLSLHVGPAAPPPFASHDVVDDTSGEAQTSRKWPKRMAVTAALLLIFGCLGLLGWHLKNQKADRSVSSLAPAAAVPEPSQPPVAASSAPGIRTLVGEGRKSYTDESGSAWETDRFCSGGDSFSVSKPLIQGTDDPQLFLGGRRGAFHCKFPLPAGIYEVHLLFAETAGLQENARTLGFTLNGGAPNYLDVVDDAGEGDAATTKVFTDVEPQNDGAIHLDFTTPDSFLNAVEILPGVPHRTLPIRIVAGRRAPYRDASGNVWLPDRYFFGGRASNVGNDVSKLPDGRLYEGQRIGHFHYAVPVAAGHQYTLKLYFLERWFGIQNQNVGGAGSRVFSVSCNGVVLLKDFDIMREAGSGGPLIKSFAHIEPTAQGKIELYFTPAVNYPSISALEVIPE
jgi:Malectin domain